MQDRQGYTHCGCYRYLPDRRKIQIGAPRRLDDSRGKNTGLINPRPIPGEDGGKLRPSTVNQLDDRGRLNSYSGGFKKPNEDSGKVDSSNNEPPKKNKVIGLINSRPYREDKQGEVASSSEEQLIPNGNNKVEDKGCLINKNNKVKSNNDEELP